MRTLVLFILFGAVFTQDRQGKIFGSEFWRNLEKGIDRVTDDLEVAIDQLGSSLEQLNRPHRATFTDRLDEQIDSALPPWLRGPDSKVPKRQIEKIEGSISGVDDGLTVYYDDDDIVKVNLKGKPTDSEGHISAEVEDVDEGTKKHVEVERVPSVSTNNPRPSFNNLGSSIFRNLFKPFSIDGSIDGIASTPYKPWWQGENVCVDRDEVDEGETDLTDGNENAFFFFTTETSFCSEDGDIYKCVTTTNKRGMKKTLTVTYRCCHGYTKEQHSCQKVNLRALSELMDDLGTSFYKNLVTTSDINDIFDTDNLTMFVPSDEAVQEYTMELEITNESNDILDMQPLDGDSKKPDSGYRVARSDTTSEMVKALTVPGIVFASKFKDEQIMETKQPGATIRMNTYGSNPPVLTANCARVTTANLKATNGVIHTIDRVVPPVTKTIFETIVDHPEFTILNQLLSRSTVSSLLEKLKMAGQLTLLAPSNKAFNSLPETTLTALLEGQVCLDSILKNHILPNVICSAALQAPKSRTINLLDDYLVIEKDENDKLTIGDATVIEKDIMATNGVIYVIDQTIIPTEAKSIMEVLSDKNLTMFLDLLETAEMLDDVAKLTDVTIFAPSNKAIEAMEEEVLNSLKDDKTALKELLNYHITTDAMTAYDIDNNHFLNTQAGHPIRMNMYTNAPLLTTPFQFQRRSSPVKVTAGCSRVSEMDNRACGGVVHVIEEVLQIPEETVMDTMANEETFSIFNQILIDTGLSDKLSNNGSFTVLAPSDYVFKALPEDELDIILKDMEIKNAIAKKHILNEHVCCTGINSNQWLFMDRKRTMDGNSLHVRRTHNGRLMAGPSRITNCGRPARNGVVHTVNHILHEVRPQDIASDISRLNQRRIVSAPGLGIYFAF